MLKRMAIFVFVLALLGILVCGCNETPSSNPDGGTTPSTKTTTTTTTTTTIAADAHGGDSNACMRHYTIYHNVPGDVYELVDKQLRQAYFTKWNASEEMTIIHFVEEFNISEEDFKRARGITDENMDELAEPYLSDGLTNRQFLDAIYRYDPANIDAAFLRQPAE